MEGYQPCLESSKLAASNWLPEAELQVVQGIVSVLVYMGSNRHWSKTNCRTRREVTYNAEDLIQVPSVAMYDQNAHVSVNVPQAQSRVLRAQSVLSVKHLSVTYNDHTAEVHQLREVLRLGPLCSMLAAVTIPGLQ